jgi:violaxanthin de-epoxidase
MASFAGAAMASQVSFAGVRDTTRRAGSKCATPVRVTTRVSGPFTNTRKLTPLHALPNNDQAQASDADADREALDEDEDESQSSTTQSSFHRRVAAGATAFALSAVLALAPPGELMLAIAKDLVDPRAVESGKCLLSRCQLELAACVADEKCAESLVCLNSCYGRPDEADCQIKCGDLYASKAVMTFNTCAITTNDCVKQKQDTGEYAVPPLANMAEGFDATVFGEEKRWYIVAGLNPDFDLFDCQEHFFDSPDPDHMAVKINWRINRPNGQFYERSDVQTFYADAESPAIMHNNGNELDLRRLAR